MTSSINHRIFIDLSFLKQKQKLLEQQKQQQQHHQQQYSNKSPSYQPQHFNRPSSSVQLNNNTSTSGFDYNGLYSPVNCAPSDNFHNPVWRKY